MSVRYGMSRAKNSQPIDEDPKPSQETRKQLFVQLNISFLLWKYNIEKCFLNEDTGKSILRTEELAITYWHLFGRIYFGGSLNKRAFLSSFGGDDGVRRDDQEGPLLSLIRFVSS